MSSSMPSLAELKTSLLSGLLVSSNKLTRDDNADFATRLTHEMRESVGTLKSILMSRGKFFSRRSAAINEFTAAIAEIETVRARLEANYENYTAAMASARTKELSQRFPQETREYFELCHPQCHRPYDSESRHRFLVKLLASKGQLTRWKDPLTISCREVLKTLNRTAGKLEKNRRIYPMTKAQRAHDATLPTQDFQI